MSKKLQDSCAYCVISGKSLKEARMCDAHHYHQYCGAELWLGDQGLTCRQGHPKATILGYAVKTKEEALRDVTRRW